MRTKNPHDNSRRKVVARTYTPTPEELEGIDRGLEDAREGRFATNDQIEELFVRCRPA
jgi:hypothetical protein